MIRLADRLPWRDRLLATLILLAWFGALAALVSCGGEMSEQPQVQYLPVLAVTYRPPAGKAGVAVIGNNQAQWAQPQADDAAKMGANWYYNWHYVADFGGVVQEV